MLIVLRFIFTYSTVTGRKCEINIVIVIVIVVWQNDDAEYSTTFSSAQYGHVHRPTHFHTLFSALMSIIGLLCIAVMILISVSRYRRHQVLMAAAARRHGGRRLISTYPHLQAGGGDVTHAAVSLPPPYCEAIAAPPPYSAIDGTSLATQSNVNPTVQLADH